ncbi:DUF2520 domain-containing protein [Collimonas sp.]|jgi:predicted short-subunit dehydrogenase-like oxidoreductase (DUF2520 family)|uniref:Rossmann-like and DUF2520 domain-containing protein n=1 Tax=Collimonas sp. TaxID=1963772 RepID=UPI002CD7FD36|nr:DUF2520 domain-containing protein [Collimonas sp.]HWX02871.1 DUF2520 domain-containing protein [Collimonas sp.]
MAGTAGSAGATGQLGPDQDDAGGRRKTLSIIGCGKLGRSLGLLWHRFGHDRRGFILRDILNRSAASAQQACDFIGAGNAASSFDDLRPADVFLIAAGDDQIAACCDALAAAGKLQAGSIVFHCSGALSSLALASANAAGATVASIHPIRSFAAPQQVADSFAGTWCGSEGDDDAMAVLGPAFEAIGAQLVAIEREQKTLYHAAAVFASNYLVTLIDVAQQAYIAAGIAPELALKLIEPLLSESAANAFRLGPATALTGPIARGDLATVVRQSQALQQWRPQLAGLYEQFAAVTSELAACKKNA